MPLKEKTTQSVIAPVGAGSNYGEVVALQNGGFMAVWVQQVLSITPVKGADDESGTAVFARTFDASGKPSGKVIQVNSKTDGFQDKPDVTVLKNGNVLIAWEDGPGTKDFDVDAKAAILSAAGKVVVKEFALASADAGEQRLPHVYATDDGGFQAAWADADPGDRWQSQRYNSKGKATGDEVKLNVYGGEDGKLLWLDDDVKVLAGTSTIVQLWQDQQQLNTNGDLVDFDYLSLPGDGYSGFESDMAVTGSDRFAVLRQDGFDVVLSLHRVDQINPLSATETTGRTNVEAVKPADPGIGYGTTLTLWDHDTDSPIAGTPNLPTYARPEAELVELNGGDLLALYVVATGGSGELDLKYTLYAQLLNSEGTRLGEPDILDKNFTYSAGGQIIRPFGAQGKNGDVFVGWTTNTDRNGEGTVELTGGTYKLKYPSATKSKKIGSGDDEIYGGKRSDKLDGQAGDDVIFGLGGKDRFDLTEGDDQVYGGGGDDVFVPGTLIGATMQRGLVDGGAGMDRLDLRYLPNGAQVGHQLTTNGGYGQRSFTLRNLEEVVGTEFDDRIEFMAGESVGLNNPNDFKQAWLRGGDDTITLATGRQTVDGGSGYDIATLNFVTKSDLTIRQTKKSVVISYEDPTYEQNSFKHFLTGFEEIHFSQDNSTMKLRATKGAQQPDAPGFGGLKQVNGTKAKDSLTGKKGSEVFDAKGGKDKVTAKGGDDVVYGGAGDDTILGGTGSDALRGQAGNDTILGGADHDWIEGGSGKDKLFGDAGDDTIFGGSGKDKVTGGDGIDTIDGGTGNDTLKGGAGFDNFEFREDFGNDVISDFDTLGSQYRDRLLITSQVLDQDNLVYTGTDLLAEYAKVKKGNTIITFDEGDSITLKGVSDLQALANYVQIDFYG